MNYMTIKTADINNGEGVRVSLWLAGCEHYCKGCHNPETWNKDAGQPFTEDTYKYLKDYLTRGMGRDLTITGGDPLATFNYDEVLALCKRLKAELPELDIMVYTGYTYDELVDLNRTEIFGYINSLVDGKFEESLKDPKLQWCGSSNQRMWVF